ncbi:unnamed protein product, partial [Tetraodon nigroviridis]
QGTIHPFRKTHRSVFGKLRQEIRLVHSDKRTGGRSRLIQPWSSALRSSQATGQCSAGTREPRLGSGVAGLLGDLQPRKPGSSMALPVTSQEIRVPHAALSQLHVCFSARRPLKRDLPPSSCSCDELIQTVVKVRRQGESWRIFLFVALNLLCTGCLLMWCSSTNSMGEARGFAQELPALMAYMCLTIFDLFRCVCSLKTEEAFEKPPSIFSFGFERLEVLAVFASTVLVQLGALFILKESVERFMEQPEVHTGRLLVGTLVALFFHLLTLLSVRNKPFSYVSEAGQLTVVVKSTVGRQPVGQPVAQTDWLLLTALTEPPAAVGSRNTWQISAGEPSLMLLEFLRTQSVRRASRPERRAAAAHEPVCPDQPGGGALPLHHLHADRDQVGAADGSGLQDQSSPGSPSPHSSPSNYNAADTASAVAIALMTFGTMYPMSVYSGKVLLQTTPPHVIGQLDKLLREVSTLDGVLEVRNEHFWTVGFGSLAGSAHVRIRRDANEQLVLAHVTNRLLPLVSTLTVQIFKDDWTRPLLAGAVSSPVSPHLGAAEGYAGSASLPPLVSDTLTSTPSKHGSPPPEFAFETPGRNVAPMVLAAPGLHLHRPYGGLGLAYGASHYTGGLNPGPARPGFGL